MDRCFRGHGDTTIAGWFIFWKILWEKGWFGGSFVTLVIFLATNTALWRHPDLWFLYMPRQRCPCASRPWSFLQRWWVDLLVRLQSRFKGQWVQASSWCASGSASPGEGAARKQHRAAPDRQETKLPWEPLCSLAQIWWSQVAPGIPLDYNNEIVRFHEFCFMIIMSIPIIM